MLVSGVVLAYDKAHTDKGVMADNMHHIDYKNPLAEVIYKNPLNWGHLSATEGFNHIENRFAQDKLHMVDSEYIKTLADNVKNAADPIGKILEVHLNKTFGGW